MPLFELLAKIKLQGADEARRGLDNVSKSAHETAGALSSRLGGAIKELGLHFADTARKASFMSVAIGGVVGAGAFQAAAKMDSLTRGLASVSANAQDLQGQLTRLREVAKLPGLGFEEAVQGSVALQAAGISARLSERSLMAFGNALASTGKGKAELDGVTLALQQIASKGKISAEEINQLTERVPQIRKAMQAAFGTSDTEALGKLGIDTTTFIDGVVSQLERLPRVTGGIQNGIENLSDAIKEALVPLGRGLADLFAGASGTSENLIATFKRVGTEIGEVLSAVGKSGVLTDIAKSFSAIFGLDFGKGLQENMVRVVSVIGSALKNLPELGKMAGDYLGKVFATVGDNIEIAFNNAFSLIKNTFSNFIAGIKADFLTAIGTMLQALPHLPGARNNTFSMGQTLLDNADAERRSIGLPKLEQFKSLPSALPSFAGLMKDADAMQSKIMANLKPYSEIPDGLNFGGGAGSQSSGVGSVFAAWDKHLADIEKNTKATADALEPRKVFGGGELAKMGVTAAEKAARPDMYTRSVNSTFQEAVRRAQRTEAQRTGRRGTPLFAR